MVQVSLSRRELARLNGVEADLWLKRSTPFSLDPAHALTGAGHGKHQGVLCAAE